VLPELDRLGIKWEAAGESQVKFCCPAHDDQTPSASFNLTEGVWRCYVPSCGAKGDIAALIAYKLKVPRLIALQDLEKRYPDQLEGVAEIPSQTIEKFHAAVWEAGPLLVELRKRGVTDEMIRAARLGFYDGRITIPVYDAQRRAVNVKRYLPGAAGPQKMRHTPGHAGPHLYNVQTLRPDVTSVWVCGGEMKALVAGTIMEGVASAVSSTGGEGSWKPAWTEQLKDKDVFVCMDVDDAGVAATRRICALLWSRVKSVRVIRLPLDTKNFPKGDINDWVGQCGATLVDFQAAMASAVEWTPPTKQAVAKGEPRSVSLRDASLSSRVGELLDVRAVVAAADQTPYMVPRLLDIECDRSQPNCHSCPVHLEDEHPDTGIVSLEIEPGAPAILGMVGEPEKVQREKIREALGIPICKVVTFLAKSHHVVHDVRVSPPIDVTGQKGGNDWYPAMVIGDKEVELNVPFKMRGAIYPHPKTQQATLLVSDCEETEDTLASFAPTLGEMGDLEIFRPRDGSDEALEEKLDQIYSDLEANVTQIFKRRDMHLAMDVAWHSPLLFSFDGRQVNGWTNVLVIGDSSQGKSECAGRLMAHYGCGDKTDCKNVTVAGLLGGLEQLGNRWFVRWGTIPQHDRALVILEELKGAPVEVLSKLTDMRSSGIAEIPKIERRRALARTRILMLSNPRSPRSMSSYHFGIEAIHELLGNLEDVRRIDLAVAVSKDDMDDETINILARNRPRVEHLVTSACSRRLILWTWTRKSEEVVFDDEATTTTMAEARTLCAKFNEAVPLVDRGSMKLKIARLAGSIAARTFSTVDGAQLLVQARHVRWASRFFDSLYSSSAMGYAEFSAAQQVMSTVQDPKLILKALRGYKNTDDLASVLLRRDTISLEDLQAACELDLDRSRQLLSLLVRKGALLRTSRSEYAKNPEFIALLKELRSDPPSRHPEPEAPHLNGEQF
jgi:hypothetical protein